MRALIFFLSFYQAAAPGEPLRSNCAPDAESIATVALADRIQVISALAGEGKPCYKITVSRPGQNLTGYVLGDALPAIREFERQREMASQAATEAQARLARAQAAAAQEKDKDKESDKPKDPLISKEFANFSGIDSNGKAVSLSGLKGRVTLVSFWPPNDGRRQINQVMPLYNELHKNGLAAVSVSLDPNPAHLADAIDEAPVTWPLMADRSGLAAQYNVDRKAGKVFVLDSEHRIVAAGPMGPDIEKAVRQLMASQ